MNCLLYDKMLFEFYCSQLNSSIVMGMCEFSRHKENILQNSRKVVENVTAN